MYKYIYFVSVPPWNFFDKVLSLSLLSHENSILFEKAEEDEKKNDIPFQPFVCFYCAMLCCAIRCDAMLFGYFFHDNFYF